MLSQSAVTETEVQIWHIDRLVVYTRNNGPVPHTTLQRNGG